METPKEPTILYVEDDPTSRTVMKMLMQYMVRLPVTILDDSAGFLDKLESLPIKPDLFLLDIHMLPIDGFEMLRQIRSHPSYQTSVVVAVTASVMNEEVTRLQQAGFNGGIAKPIDQSAFPDLIKRLLNGEAVWHIT